jgi:RES domain
VNTGACRRCWLVWKRLALSSGVDVDSTHASGVWWRHVPAGADVYFEPPDPADNRWQHGTIVEALYFADSEATAWAEWYRYLAEAGVAPEQGLPRDLWRWEISLSEIADLSDEGRLARVGLPALQPTRLQWPAFQLVGERLHREGWPALLSASAARPVGQTLCVFRASREVPGTQPLPPPTTVTHAPVVPTGMRT